MEVVKEGNGNSTKYILNFTIDEAEFYGEILPCNCCGGAIFLAKPFYYCPYDRVFICSKCQLSPVFKECCKFDKKKDLFASLSEEGRVEHVHYKISEIFIPKCERGAKCKKNGK